MAKQQWTEARKNAFIRGVLRAGMRKYPPKWEVMEKAFVGRKVNKSTGRLAKHYKCAKCKEEFPTTQVQVDHKKPVIDVKDGFINWDTFIERLYCAIRNLQVLCKDCHKKKTDLEKKRRMKYDRDRPKR